jgi:hypothetical protein
MARGEVPPEVCNVISHSPNAYQVSAAQAALTAVGRHMLRHTVSVTASLEGGYSARCDSCPWEWQEGMPNTMMEVLRHLRDTVRCPECGRLN